MWRIFNRGVCIYISKFLQIHNFTAKVGGPLSFEYYVLISASQSSLTFRASKLTRREKELSKKCESISQLFSLQTVFVSICQIAFFFKDPQLDDKISLLRFENCCWAADVTHIDIERDQIRISSRVYCRLAFHSLLHTSHAFSMMIIFMSFQYFVLKVW